MTIRPLDEPTYKLAQDTLNRARMVGNSPIHALHMAGLLLGPDLANQLRFQALNAAAEHLACIRFRDLIGPRYLKHSATPSEVRAAVVERLETLAELARRGEFR